MLTLRDPGDLQGLYSHLCANKHIYIYAYIHTHAYTHIYIPYIHTCIYTYTCVHTHIYTKKVSYINI